MNRKRLIIAALLLGFMLIGCGSGIMFVHEAQASTPAGSYSITQINTYSSAFSISLEGTGNPIYFNVFKKSANTMVNPIPQSITESINSLPVVFADIADLEVVVYSDAAGSNIIAEYTLNSSNQLVAIGATVIAVTGVTLNKTTATIAAGDSEQLEATVAPADATDKSVSWNSSDTNIATVSSTGLVTAVNAGTAVVTVTSNADSSKYAECAVTVTAAPAANPNGSYSITPINQFASAFSITLQDLSNANYFNVFKKSNDTLVNDKPVSIDIALNSMPAVYADIADLEVRVYSDAAGTNLLAEFTLSSSGQLVLKGSGTDECFIATAAFGSKFDGPVVLLRQFRDRFLLTNSPGTAFDNLYYHYSPPVAAVIADSQPLKMLVRTLLAPVVAVVYLLFHPLLMIVLMGLLIISGVYWTKRRTGYTMP